MTRFFFLLCFFCVACFARTDCLKRTVSALNCPSCSYPVVIDGYCYVDASTQLGIPGYSCGGFCGFTTSSCHAAFNDCEDDYCEPYKIECESAGGSFRGTTVSDNGQNCCRGSCNVCGSDAMKKLYDAKKKICCENGLAPPDEDRTCNTVNMPTSGCGMVWSTYGDFTTGGWSCADPSSSFEAGARYGTCFDDGSSSSGGGSSSSAGSSSSGDGSSSSGGGDDGGCKECPWLDSILDTLTAQKHVVENIYSCLTVPALCTPQQTNDSLSFPSWVKPVMDSNLHAVLKVDSSVLKQIKIDSVRLKNDTVTWSKIDESVSFLTSSLDAVNDSSEKLLNQLITRIRDFENRSIDSNSAVVNVLNDSAIKYFNEVLNSDSSYRSKFLDSLGAIHSAFGDIAITVGYDLGYGDTASSTLRKDLGGIKGALDDLNGKFDASAVDTGAVGFGNGWAEHGERLADSIAREVGWKDGLDTVDIDGVFSSNAFDSLNVDSINGVINDSLIGLSDSLASVLSLQNDSLRSALPESLTVWADTLRAYSPFASFDSLVFESLGAKIPNSDVCPEDCQKWTINLPRFGLVQYDVDMGLCLGRSYIGNMNVLSLIRLLVRIVVVWSCIWIVFNALTRRND